MNGRGVAVVVLSVIALDGCGLRSMPDESTQHGTADPLGIFSTALPDDMDRQALETLKRDARRREERFLDAVSPGHLARSTVASEADIEAGLWSADELFQIGAQLFNLQFTPAMGYGAKDLPHLARFHTGRRGGPDAMQCASCHWRGGPAGAGDAADNAYLDGDGDSQSSALARNPIPLHGAGLVEVLASEMNADLASRKAVLLTAAKATGKAQSGPLTSKGISFGVLEARPDGQIDVTHVEGVDPDLVIKPFGWKGNMATIRDAVEDALLVHHGMESTHLVDTAPVDRIGPFGGSDPDGDGVTSEISEGQLSALTLFVAMQEMPISALSTNQDILAIWPAGQQRFQDIGCATCHIRSLPLDSSLFILPSREGEGGHSVQIDLAREGAEPRIAPSADGGYALPLFSDLKRHDIGTALAEKRSDRGTLPRQFMTRPLWGIARSRPYLHDARAPTLEDAILLHGGEAQDARDAYAALSETERAPVRVYLMSLTRAQRMISP